MRRHSPVIPSVHLRVPTRDGAPRGKKQIDESGWQPLRYYRENIEGLHVLLEAVTTEGVEQFVSSSAAVYGAPDVDLVDVRTECLPVDPCGRTKLIGEHMLAAAGYRRGGAHPARCKVSTTGRTQCGSPCCLTTSCMVSRGPSLTCSGRVRSRGGAGRESFRRAGKRFGSWGSFLAGDQSGDRGQDRVEVFASVEVS
jgi:NAD-dependent epimerase/dehydratase family protein